MDAHAPGGIYKGANGKYHDANGVELDQKDAEARVAQFNRDNADDDELTQARARRAELVAKSDAELIDRFTVEAINAGYGDDAAKEIAEDRLRDLRSGGDGSRRAPPPRKKDGAKLPKSGEGDNAQGASGENGGTPPSKPEETK